MKRCEFIDGELCIIDGDEIIHVFERENISRSSYKHMTGWIQEHYDESEPNDLWERAQKAWDNLSVEHKMIIWSLTQQEKQNAEDISMGLLATLGEYQGLASVKSVFKECIKKGLDKFS